ncbi:MAG: hypothetical protein QW745_09150, partial [Thermoplasmata archaeon]
YVPYDMYDRKIVIKPDSLKVENDIIHATVNDVEISTGETDESGTYFLCVKCQCIFLKVSRPMIDGDYLVFVRETGSYLP